MGKRAKKKFSDICWWRLALFHRFTQCLPLSTFIQSRFEQTKFFFKTRNKSNFFSRLEITCVENAKI